MFVLYLVITIGLVSWCLSVAGLAGAGQIQEIMGVKGDDKLEDKIIPDAGESYENVRSKTACLAYCARNSSCMSFFYLKLLRRCVLHNIVYISTSDMVDSDNTSYYIVGDSSKCPINQGFYHERNMNSCYKVIIEVATMIEAIQMCSAIGAVFGHPFVQNVYEHITSLYGASYLYRKRTFFTGLVLLSRADYVFHSDASSPSFYKWANNETFTGDCVVTSFDIDWTWQTSDCSRKKAFFCTYPMFP